MKLTFKEKGIGLYLATAAAVLALIAVILYSSAADSSGDIVVLLVIGLLVLAGVIVASFFKNVHWLNLGFFVAAVLFTFGLVLSLSAQINQIGYVVAGLDPYSTISTYVTSLILGIVALLLTIAASFFGLQKTKG